MKLQIGEQVSCCERAEAFYSGYAGRPIMAMVPGDIGTVAAVNVTPVCGNTPYHCVDFFCSASGRIERCALRSANIVRLKGE